MSDYHLERVYDEHVDHLFHFLLSLKLNEDVIKDLIQQLFVKLAARPELIQRARDERPYLMRMVYRLYLDELRRRERHSGFELNDEAKSTDLFEAGRDVDAEVMRQNLESAVTSLPETQRLVVVLKLWHDHSFAEIAEVVGEPMGTVTSRYRYGIDKMREHLRHLYEELK